MKKYLIVLTAAMTLGFGVMVSGAQTDGSEMAVTESDVQETQNENVADILVQKKEPEKESVVGQMENIKKSGWDNEKGYWVYYDNNETLHKGWLRLGNRWYYLETDNEECPGRMVSGVKREINGYTYFFENGGGMLTGWVKMPEGYYYTAPGGNQLVSWIKQGNYYYYCDKSNEGLMVSDCEKRIGAYDYFFGENGQMLTGWVRRPEGWYYADSSGRKISGWIRIGNRYYYLNPEDAEYPGRMVSGVSRTINGRTYFFENGGGMLTGWIKRPEGYYYADGSGTQKLGWLKIGKKWYYLNPGREDYPGLMESGSTIKIGTSEYIFKDNGEMYSGWRYVAGEGYYFYDENYGQKISGWKQVAGKWYYMDPENERRMISNSWKSIHGSWYYFKSNGEMAVKWLRLNQNYYYFSASGVMKTGWQDIDGSRYYFNKYGIMEHDTTIDGIALDSSGRAKSYQTKIGSFYTISTNTANGTYNMSRALLSFNQLVIQSGQTVSFFGIAGPCGKSQGYKPAGVVGGTGYGGGICQASTTLYGAVLRGGLTIVERRNHSVPSTYVPIGQDAMVNYGSSDFKFRNDYTYPVKLVTYVQGNTLYAEVWGQQPAWFDTVKISSWKTGSKSAVAYRYYIKNGVTVKTEQLPNSYYR